MELDSHSGRVSNPYKHPGDWAKQLTRNDADEPAKLSWEDDDDGRKLSAGDESQVDGMSDSDSIEAIIDIYLDIQRQRVQENANNPYELLDKWAKRFDHDQEEKQNPCASDSTEKRARPDADDPIDNHGDDSGDNNYVNSDDHTIGNGKNVKDQERDKQTKCKHKSVISGLLRTFFNSAALCECEQDTASMVQSRSARGRPESTGRSFRQTLGIGSNNGHSKIIMSSQTHSTFIGFQTDTLKRGAVLCLVMAILTATLWNVFRGQNAVWSLQWPRPENERAQDVEHEIGQRPRDPPQNW